MKQTQYIYADLDEMLFENRERNYGAYELRTRYNQRLLKASVTVLLLFFLGILAPHIANLMAGPEENLREYEGLLQVNPLPQDPPPVEKKEIIPPPPPPKPPEAKQIAHNIPEPTPEDELEAEDLDNSIHDKELLAESKNIGLFDRDGEDLDVIFSDEIEGTGDIPVVLKAEPEPSPNDFVFVEEEPQPINMNEVAKEIGYPQVLKDAAIEGNVVIRVLVDEFGKYQKHIVINKIHPALSAEVEKHIAKLKFTPAIQGGKAIKFWVNIPFNFKLL